MVDENNDTSFQSKYGMKTFAIFYGIWLLISFGLDVGQLLTTTLCTYAPGREWGPNNKWYVQDKDDGDDYWENRIDDDKWFADDAEKVDENGDKVKAGTRKTYWDEADQGTPLIKTPQGQFLVLVTLLGIFGNVGHMLQFFTSDLISTFLYIISVLETMDQYFILNLTCSSYLDGASFMVSALGLMTSSSILYFKCVIEIKHAEEEPTSENKAAASTAKTWKFIYGFIGFGAVLGSFIVGAYAVNVYPMGSLENILGFTAVICCVIVFTLGFCFGERFAKYLLLLSKNLTRSKKAVKGAQNIEMGAQFLSGA